MTQFADAVVVPPGLPQEYELLRHIATGAFTEVWKVCARSSGQPYAWKHLRSEWESSELHRELLRSECQAAQRVSGRFVPRIHADLTERTPPGLIRDWIDGSSLADMLGQEERLAVAKSFWIARQVAEGLVELNSCGTVHGNLTSSHVLLGDDGQLKLIGLGFARATGDAAENRNRLGLLTDAHCLAPETGLNGLSRSFASDVYSLGILLFRMLTGRWPFAGENGRDILRLHREARPPAIKRYCPQLPPESAAFVERLLSKQPLRRPQSPEELLGELLTEEVRTMTFRQAG